MERIRNVLLRALQEAGLIVKGGLSGKKVIEYKGRANLVTQVDKAAEHKILKIIRKAFPSHLILAEETASHKKLMSPSPSGTMKWIIDPLDGTTNFVHSLPIACISIGVESDGEVRLGGIYDPFREELFWAEKGKGSRLNGRKIQVSDVGSISEALLVTGFPYDRRERADFYVSHFKEFMKKTQGIRRLGAAALDLCYLACGRFDGYWEFNLKPWDTAAGQLLVKEAGGRLTDIQGNPYSLYGSEIVASNGHIHEAMLEILGVTPSP